MRSWDIYVAQIGQWHSAWMDCFSIPENAEFILSALLAHFPKMNEFVVWMSLGGQQWTAASDALRGGGS